MAEKNNAKCSICGRDYYACIACKDSMSLSPWKIHTDTAEHYKVFQIVRGYSTGIYTKDEAKEKFKNVDLRDIESFRPHIKKLIKDILKEEKPVVKDVVVEKEAPIIEKTTVSRRKNFKVNDNVEETE